MTEFVHLHLHSEFSLLDGACRLSKLPDRVLEVGQNAVALTDHGVMYGAVEFYRACKSKGVKPIIGCEVYVAPGSRHARSYQKGEWHSHLVLLCENEVGYRNLIHLVSMGFAEGFYVKPRIDMELLAQYSEGLICLSACLGGAIPRALAAGDQDEARALCAEFLEIFDREHFYLEVQDQGIAIQKKVNNNLFHLAREFEVDVVATNDAHYLTRYDAKMQDVLMSIQMGKTVDDPTRMKFETDEFYVKSAEEMRALFPSHPEVLENTVKIAARCNVEFAFGQYHLPAFTVPDGKSALSYLQQCCDEGFSVRYPHDDGTVRARLQYEIDMIAKMGFVDYFLIVADFIGYAKKQGIPVGPGRGSAAGSLVSYCLGITDLDPIHYSLYFERFLNPERVSMPDIDIDFCYVRRPEVIEYVMQKYGRDHVAQIVTFGTMAARAAIRDVGRALSMSYNEVDAVAKKVPNELHITIDKALAVNTELRDWYETKPHIRELLDTARALEGVPRHASTHAAGVVITKNAVDTYVPLARNDDQLVTQFTMNTLEELGLLKMDFLGLRTLTVIADAERMVRQEFPDFSIEKISLQDEATYEMLGRGATVGVFQLESPGITNVVTGLRPQSIEDITAVVALYRPGPMQSIPRYIDCKHHPEHVTYRHPLLEPILKVTYGCMVYQEQVMQVFQSLAGYPLGKADMVRRAMSKKKMKELEKERVTFLHGDPEAGIDGAIKRGVPHEVAAALFDEIMDFANYAFNKAHAVSYAIVSYRTAYLKCHYPRTFMAALLTSVLDTTDKVSEYIRAVREMGIEVLPPDVNESEDSFSVSGRAIRFGLAAVKGVGRGFVRHMVEEREAHGAFRSFQDFCERMESSGLNRRTLESLIKAGAFDSMGHTRRSLLQVAGTVLDAIAQDRRTNMEGQLNLFGADMEDARLVTIPPAQEKESKKELLIMEKEATGLYLSGHPMDGYRALSQQAGAAPIRRVLDDLAGESDKPQYCDGMSVRLACVITQVRERSTKNNKRMAYINVEDDTGGMEVIVFPRTIEQYGSRLVEDRPVLLSGRIDAREDEAPRLVLSEVGPLNEQTVGALAHTPAPRAVSPPSFSEQHMANDAQTKLFLRIASAQSPIWSEVKAVLQRNTGQVPVYLYPLDTKKRMRLARQLWCNPTTAVCDQLTGLLGQGSVVLAQE